MDDRLTQVLLAVGALVGMWVVFKAVSVSIKAALLPAKLFAIVVVALGLWVAVN